ncbi:MAG TPA: uroporphyrinogen-III C-methyltransferase [Rhodocyclaceae bacterium]|nr:uroporphyrinogen-III C-methyltransferase [Rhodocyclaceae bacterium]
MDADTPALTQPQPHPQAAWRRALAATLRPAVLIAVASLLLLGWQWLETRVRLTQLQTQVAQRLAENDAAAQEGRALGRQNQEALQALTIKVGALEAKLAEAQGQQVALDAMYQELSKGRDQRLLAEVEQAVAIAAQQLQLAGNVEAALIALQSADQRLARAGHAQFLPLRKLLNRDIDRLKALPLADVPGIALKLEGVIGAIDGLPLAFEQRTRAAPSAAPAAKTSLWVELGRELWSEMKLLIRVERIDQTEPALLPPNQSFFLRENLKLRLVDARLALLQHDGRSFREDLHQARDWLVRYFDQRAKPVQNAIATLNALASADLAVELPTLNDTLASLRSFKLAREQDRPIRDRARVPAAKGRR